MGTVHFMVIINVMIFIVKAESDIEMPLYRCSSFKKVTGSCKECNSPCRLPVISKQEDYELVKRKMEEKKVTATWLGLRRVWLGEYLWLDCSKPFDDFLRQNWKTTDGNCVSLHLDMKADKAQLEPGSCELPKASLCQVTGCNSCHDIKKDKHCWKIDNTCFVVEHNPFNWEYARVACQKMEGSLAIITGDQTRDNIKMKLNPNKPKNYWIGLRREEWTYPNMEFVPLKITTIHWDKGQPTGQGNCSIMVKSGDDYVWRVAPCSAKYNALCMKPGQHIGRSQNGQRPTKNPISTIRPNISATRIALIRAATASFTSSEVKWIVGIGGAIIVLLVSLLAVSICTCTRQPSKIKTNRTPTHQNGGEGEANRRLTTTS